MGWLNMWDRNIPSREYGFAGQLTVPRHITISNGKLLQTPVWDYSNQIESAVEGSLKDNIKHGAIKFVIENLKCFELKLRQKDDQYFKVSLVNNEFVFDRSKMKNQVFGLEKDPDSLNFIRRMPIDDLANVTIEIIMDEFSLEFFINGLSASFQVFNDVDAEELNLELESSNCKYIKSLFQ